MTSTRYAIPVILLLLLAIIPTAIHNYFNLTTTDALSVNKINPMLGEFTSAPSSRLPIWGQETFACTEWFERIYTDGQNKPLLLFVGSSYDHKRLYHHPELALSYAKDLKMTEQISLPGHPDIAVNVLRNDRNPLMAGYVLYYDGKFIDNPIAHQIKDSLKQLVSPRKKMTMFYVYDDHAPENISFKDSAGAVLLKNAIEDFLAQQH